MKLQLLESGHFNGATIIVIIMLIVIIIIIIITTIGQRPSNWGHHLYYFKVDGNHSYDRYIHKYCQSFWKPTV
mgnify:CR=1 FL=1